MVEYGRFLFRLMFIPVIVVGFISSLFLNSAGAEEHIQDDMKVKTITVTARKQKENIQEVPTGITVFNDESIMENQIQVVEDLGGFVPNLVFMSEGQSGRKIPSLRGLNAPSFSLSTPVGLYVDGVPILNGVGYVSEILDIERIEVLRGPQGTLYGKNTEVGVINIITKSPDNKFRGKVTAQGSSWLSKETGDGLGGRITASLSGPVVRDKLYFGIAGLYYQRDGFMENSLTGGTLDDRQRWFGRAHLRWEPTEKMDISITASKNKFDDDAPRLNNTDAGAAGSWVPEPKYRKVPANMNGYNKSVVDSQALRAVYRINEELTFTSVTTNRVYDEDTGGDWDFSSQTLGHNIIDRKYERTAQELRLDYAKKRLKWLVGAYCDRDEKGVGYRNISDFPKFNMYTDRSLEGNSYAFFANLTYPVTNKIGFISGLRYEHQESEFTDHKNKKYFDDSWDMLSPKVGLEYQASPEIMTYATVAKGYRSGGFNPHAPADESEYQSYDAEELWSWEIGTKNVFFDNRLILNISAYYMDIKDMQVSEAVIVEGVNQSTSYISNAAEATSKGIELEINGRITKGLTLSAAFGYNDIEFDKFKDSAGDYSDNKNPLAPEYTFSLGALYRHSSGFTAKIDYLGYGEMYLGKTNEFPMDAYEIVNMKLGYETEAFDIYLYGKNIFDEKYDLDGYFDGYYTMYSDPGEVGLEAVYRF